jgi:hypothetical protein
MAKHDPIRQALERLGSLHSAPDDASLPSELRESLHSRSNLVVAKASKIAAVRRVSALVPDLVAAFHRFMADPARLDKRCEATTEIASTLYALNYLEAEIYLAGLHHVQMEGSFGPPRDAAAQLRGICAQGLTRTRYAASLEDVVSLLVDPEPPARVGAVRALAANGGSGGLLALRLKVLMGDPVPEVIAECFSGLLAVPSENSVNFVAGYIHSRETQVAEAAILALGASRSPKALKVLEEQWEQMRRGPLRKVLLLALTSTRSEDALNFLLQQMGAGPLSAAAEILTALAAQRPSASIRQSIAAAVQRRGEAALERAYKSEFPD